MRSSWQIEAGHLECRWSEVGQPVRYNPPWMQEARDVQGSYLPPLPDFASHSPFVGTTWYDRHAPRCDSE
jgi:hypothetical protein